jgi:O-antigen/teichoic acid export membrane protein
MSESTEKLSWYNLALVSVVIGIVGGIVVAFLDSALGISVSSVVGGGVVGAICGVAVARLRDTHATD